MKYQSDILIINCNYRLMYAHLWGELNTKKHKWNETIQWERRKWSKTEYQGVTTVQSMQWNITVCGYILSKQL